MLWLPLHACASLKMRFRPERGEQPLDCGGRRRAAEVLACRRSTCAAQEAGPAFLL